MTYSVTPKSYLGRAKTWILTEDPENLPYAALNLRACVEARQALYYEACNWRRGQKIRPWQVNDLSKKLHEHWQDQKIAQIVYRLPTGDWTTYFTPVTKALVKSVAEDLGELLHSVPAHNASNDAWWVERRRRIIDCYRQAWVACKGQHIAMPLWDPRTREMHPAMMYGEDEELDNIHMLSELLNEGSRLTFSIDYLSEPPASWVCDV